MRKIINTDLAPKAVGPYSQAVMVDDLLFVSGQLPIDPVTNELVEDDIIIQTRRSFENIKTILNEAGMTLDNVVKTNVFLKDIKEFGAMNEVYATYFNEGNYPARIALEVAAIPKGARVEIEVIAKK